MASGLNSGGDGCDNNDPQSGTMLGQGQFFIYLPKRVDGRHYVRTPVKVKAEMILSPKLLDEDNMASIIIPCRARLEKLSSDNVLSVINVPIKIEAELLLTPDMSFSCKPPNPPNHTEVLDSVTKPFGPDLQRAFSTFPAAQDEEDVLKILIEKPVQTDDSQSAGCMKSFRTGVPPVTFKNQGPVGASLAPNRSHNTGLILPMRNLKELSELPTHLQPQPQEHVDSSIDSMNKVQRAMVTRRREPMVCQREQMFSQRKLEREKQMRTSDAYERKKSNLYLQQYLRRESFSRQSSVQDAEAVRRRETLMQELGMKLKDELGMRQVHNIMRNFPTLRS